MDDFEKNKEYLASIMRRLYSMKLTTTLGGNISMLLPDKTMLITPSGSDKSNISFNDVGRMALNGEIIGAQFIPSIESSMHIEIYNNRDDINVIIHAHPPYLSAFSATTAKINTKLTVETYALLGNVAYAEYAPMGTLDLATNVANSAKESNCILMRNHGAVTIGKTFVEAFDRMEVFENAARMSILTGINLKESFNPLSLKQCEIIDKTIINLKSKQKKY
jgi:L-fuculose-phosphate aldolase